MMKPAVRELNAFWLLLRKDAVPALLTAVAISPGVAGPPRTTQTPSTYPSRSVTAMTLFGEIFTARVTAWLITRCTSRVVSWARTVQHAVKYNARLKSARRHSIGRSL